MSSKGRVNTVYSLALLNFTLLTTSELQTASFLQPLFAAIADIYITVALTMLLRREKSGFRRYVRHRGSTKDDNVYPHRQHFVDSAEAHRSRH